MKRSVLALCMSAVLMLSACGGRTANPVMVQQYGDQAKTCEQLHYEITNVQNEMQRILPKTSKVGKNVALGVAGYFLLVPFFFMDFKNADKKEYEALRQRYNHLTSIAIGKNCQVEKEHYPSIEELEREYKNKKEEQEAGSPAPRGSAKKGGRSGPAPSKQRESSTYDEWE